jgi:hypothetical protein
MTKHIFQNSVTGLYYNGNGFFVDKNKAVRYPTSVTLIYFRYNHKDAKIIQEEVEDSVPYWYERG